MLDMQKISKEQHELAHELAERLTETVLAFAREREAVPATLLYALDMNTGALRGLLVEAGFSPVEILGIQVSAVSKCAKACFEVFEANKDAIFAYQNEVIDEAVGLTADINCPGGAA